LQSEHYKNSQRLLYLLFKIEQMDYFRETSFNRIANTESNGIRRYLMDEIDWNHRLIGIKGFRGVGKTTFLLDYLRENFPADSKEILYVNLNSLYFTGRKIAGFADDFYKRGGKVLVLDQIHKYPSWAEELRECYDTMPELKIIFSAPSVLRIVEGNECLKDIVHIYHLCGLSFREFLNYKTQQHFTKYTFDEIVENHVAIAAEIASKVKPLAYFEEYLHHGCYPFFLDRKTYFADYLLKQVNLTLEIDVTYLNQIELKYLSKLRKLLYIIANEVPFCPNVSKLSADIETSRATVMNYLRYLKNARLINLLYTNGDEDQQKKPTKVYMQNTNLLNTVAPTSKDKATNRETFFYNQVSQKNTLKSVEDFDFKVNDRYLFSVGGKHNEPTTENSYAAADRIEVGEGNKIPLWLFGFLY